MVRHYRLLEAEESTPLLAKRIYHQSTQEQTYRDTNRDLNHAASYVECNVVWRSIDTDAKLRVARSVRCVSRIVDFVGHLQTTQQASSACQSSRNLGEDSGYQYCSSNTMSSPGIKVRHSTNGESAECAGDLWA